MRIKEGTVLGQLAEGNGTSVAEVSMGKMVELGLMQGVPQWLTEKGGTLLFFLSFTQQTVVTKGGIRQAGAFLLRPGEEIILRNGAEKKKTRYSFIVNPLVEVVPEEGERCDFCRASLGDHGVWFSVDVEFRGDKLLCRSCSDAWGEQAGFNTIATPREAEW